MKTLARPALRSAATSISTMAGVRIRALTERHPIKPTSPRCHSAWQLNLGRHSTYRRGKSVQTTGTTSVLSFHIDAHDRAVEVGISRAGQFLKSRYFGPNRAPPGQNNRFLSRDR